MFLSISKVATLLGVCVGTVRNYEKTGILVPSHRTRGGHRRYLQSAVEKFFFDKNTVENAQSTICYCRVSSHDQKQDLERQKESLETYCQIKGYENVEVISDLGSGINMKKKGLKKLLLLILTGQVSRIVLSHKDRLLRFGAELIFQICRFFNIEVVITEEEKPASFEEDLARDVICVLTVFTAKLYGKRSHQKRKMMKELQAA